MRLFAALSLALCSGLSFADKPIDITFLHLNDLHAHVESTMIRKKPYGGYARLATLVKRERAANKNLLLLNAGDTFQGTIYFNVYEGLADAAALNSLGVDAATIGNHEFDHGPAALAAYMQAVDFPVISSNITSSDSVFGPLVKPSTVLMVGGERIGVVGATTPDTSNISQPGPTVQFANVQGSVQREIDKLTGQGINKIVLLTHIGYEEDQALVPKLRGVDLVIGGHSHSPLGTPTIDGWRNAEGPYPTLVKNADGDIVPIVQGYEWGKVMGEIKLSFNARGKVVKVVAARPIVVDETVPEDRQMKALVAAFQKPIAAQANAQIGTTVNAVPKEANASGESLMANVIADAMLAATEKMGAVAAFVNSGGVRGSLEQGKVTYGNLISIAPFGNTLVVLDLTGAELLGSLHEGEGTGGQLNPSHGTSYKVVGGKVTGVIVAGQALDTSKIYRVSFYNFTANGGDKHVVLQNAKGRRVDTGLLDIDVLTDYVRGHVPLDVQAEGRILRG